MTLIQYFYLYLVTVPVFFAIDIVWIAYVAEKFYRDNIGYLLGPVNWPAAILFYLIYIAAILLFAVGPALEADSLAKAAVLGAVFGFVAYATYDMTNQALVKDWPVIVTVVDMAWGTLLTGTVATISYYLAKTFIL